MYQVSQKKYTHLMSHNTTSTASILKIQLGLDGQDFKLVNDSIKIHFVSLLIELLMHKLAASF